MPEMRHLFDLNRCTIEPSVLFCFCKYLKIKKESTWGRRRNENGEEYPMRLKKSNFAVDLLTLILTSPNLNLRIFSFIASAEIPGSICAKDVKHKHGQNLEERDIQPLEGRGLGFALDLSRGRGKVEENEQRG